MTQDNIARNLHALVKAEKIVADIKLQHLLTSFGLKMFAALIAAFGLLMAELAAYFALIQIWSAITAAVTLAAINFIIAAAIFIVAAKRPTSRELDLANEVHDAAIQNLKADFHGYSSHPTERLLPSLVLPLITMAIEAFRKSKSAEPAAAE